MAVSYANCFQLSKVNPKCHLFSSSNGLSTRVSPVYSCLKTPGRTLPLEAKNQLYQNEKKSYQKTQTANHLGLKRLLLDEKLLCSKIREEADELCRTLEENEEQSRTASEMADVLYHAMVLLARKGVKVEDVLPSLETEVCTIWHREKEESQSSTVSLAGVHIA